MQDEKPSWWDKFTSIRTYVKGKTVFLFPFVLFVLAWLVFVKANGG